MATKSFNRKIIIYDGHCPMCNKAIGFIHAVDKGRKFEFISRYSSQAENYRAQDIDSIMVVDGGLVYCKSQAVIYIFAELGYPYKFLIVFKIIPIPWLEAIYDFVARNRNRWFHSESKCDINI